MIKIHKAKIMVMIPIVQEYKYEFYEKQTEAFNEMMREANTNVAYKFLNSCVANDWKFSEEKIFQIGKQILKCNDFRLISHFFYEICTRKQNSSEDFLISTFQIAELLVSIVERYGTEEVLKIMKKFIFFGYNVINLESILQIINDFSLLVVERSDSVSLLSFIYFAYDLYADFYLTRFKELLDHKSILYSFYLKPNVVSSILLCLSELFIRDRQFSSSIYPVYLIQNHSPLPPIDKEKGFFFPFKFSSLFIIFSN